MDPGIGLMVNSMAPTKRRAPKSLPKPAPKPPPYPHLNLPPDFLNKAHVRHALKFMTTDEECEATLAVAMKWKQKFEANKWTPVVSAIRTARNEDHVRCPPEQDEPCDKEKTVLDLEPSRVLTKPALVRPRQRDVLGGRLVRPRDISQTTVSRRASLKPRTSWREVSAKRERTPVPTTPVTARRVWREVSTQSERTHDNRTPLASTPARFRWEVGTSGLTTPLVSSKPRDFRWDVLTPGPRTPLSTAPSVNSFSNWIKPKSAPPEWQRTTPVQATYTEPGFGPLPSDVEACEVYLSLKTSIEALARKHCLGRFQARSSGGDFLPATMITSHDLLQAARLTMYSSRTKVKHIITEDLPKRIKRHAAGETEMRRFLSINTKTQLREQARWINYMSARQHSRIARGKNENGNIDEPPAVSILEEQRDLLRNFREQREREFLTLDPVGLEVAWAVKITEDMERLAENDSDSDWSDSDSDIHDEGYSYGNILRTIKSEMSTNSSSTSLASMMSDNDLTLRSRSNTQTSNLSRESKRSASPRWPTRLSGSTITSTTPSSHLVLDLAIVAETSDEDPSAQSPLTPQDREFRHRGPDLAELDHWAQELKRMETMRAERRDAHPLHRSCTSSRRLSTNTSQSHSRFSSSSSSSSSSAGTTILNPLPRPPVSLLSPPPRPAVLDHEYHQRKLSQPHKRKSGESSLYDSMRPLRASTESGRSTGAGSAGSRGTWQDGSEGDVQVRVRSVPRLVADEWGAELERMEKREKERQGGFVGRHEGEGEGE